MAPAIWIQTYAATLPFDCNLTLFSDNFGFPDALAFNSSESALSGGGDGDDITLLHGTSTFDDKTATPLPPPPLGNTTLFGDDFGFQDGLALDSREFALGGGNGDIILLHGNPTFNDTIAAAAAAAPPPPSPPADSVLHCETEESEATARRHREIQVANDQCARASQGEGDGECHRHEHHEHHQHHHHQQQQHQEEEEEEEDQQHQKPLHPTTAAATGSRRENNRLAAAKVRAKARRETETIDATVRAQSERNSRLKQDVHSLRDELTRLRMLALKHQTCFCTAVTSYNLRQAGRVARQWVA